MENVDFTALELALSGVHDRLVSRAQSARALEFYAYHALAAQVTSLQGAIRTAREAQRTPALERGHESALLAAHWLLSSRSDRPSDGGYALPAITALMRH